MRVPAFIAAVALGNCATALDGVKRRYPELAAEHETCTFRARLADVDRNRHVNNIRYMDWVIESVSGIARNRMRVADLEIVFRSEAYWKDVIGVRTMEETSHDAPKTENALEGERIFWHSLVRKGDGKEMARAAYGDNAALLLRLRVSSVLRTKPY